ncbi:molybdopterin molybdotransferase MoeA [Pseudanabaena biceps]|nr:molybdopterin molybdotransferase MoeA [Pseudanabaena biceps]
MLSVSEVEKIILDLVKPFDPAIDSELLPLSQAIARVLAEDVSSKLDFPHWDNSAMDGYALRYADLEDLPELKLAIAPDEISAGISRSRSLATGECIRIFTGGMLPNGADTVIMQEDVEPIDNFLYLKTKPTHGEYVRHKGQYIQAGTTLVDSGTRITATEIGALAAARCPQVRAYRQPKIAIISTGNELVNLDSSQPLQAGQIIDSNIHALSALITQAGAIAIPFGAIPDDLESLEKVMQQAIASTDMVISTGGVSVGDYDYIDGLLEKLGAEIYVRSVAIKPGKPLTVASLGKVLYFGVPGNPVSSMMSFWRFIRGAIAKLNGANSTYWYPQFIKATTTQDLHAQGRRETYLWGKLTYEKGNPVFQPVSDYSSGNFISAIGANATAVMRVNQTYVSAGDEAIVMFLNG